MKVRPEELAERFSALLAVDDDHGFLQALEDVPAADVAEVIRNLDDEKIAKLFKTLPEEFSAAVLVEIGEDIREDVLELLTPHEIAEVVEEMDSDDAADIFSELEEERAGEVAELLEAEDRAEIAQLLAYPEDSAGGIMQLEVVSVGLERTVARAIEKIRLAFPDVGEDFHFVYVTDDEGRLVGKVPLPRLLISRADAEIRSLLDDDVHAVFADLDQEEVAQIFRKYDLPSVPVVDHENRLLGRITVDDILDVIQEEAAEDYSRLAGTDDEEFREESIYRKAGLRLPWLVTGLGGGLLSAFVLSRFEVRLESLIALAFFVPVITAMGGNVAIQSSAVMVRGLAVGQVTGRDAVRRLGREVGVSIITGMICAGLVFLAAWLWWGDLRLGIVVGSAMLAVILISTSVGAFVPLTLSRVKIDPALATGPFVTTSNDILGILIYMGMATWVYGLLP
jgi:magnesium transporter